MSESNVTRISKARRLEREQRQARSLYGQIRLTVTFSPTGEAWYRALAKRPDDDWREMHVFAAGHQKYGQYPPTFADALEDFADVAQLLRWLPSERK